MQDGIIKGTGNSWFLKSVPNFLTLYPTYESFVQAMVAGTLPIDLNGMNSSGWSKMGTALNKANLLKDATAALYGLTAAAVPDQVLATIPLGVNIGWNQLQTYQTAGTYTWTAPNLFGGKNYRIGVLVIGGGGSGGFNKYANGGGSGFTVSFQRGIAPGSTHSIVVGAGGASVPYSANGAPGKNGGASSFDGISALGGTGGAHSNSSSFINGSPGAQPSTGVGSEHVVPFGGQPILTKNTNGAITGVIGQPMQCFNPFENTRILGGGGGVRAGQAAEHIPSGKDPVTGKGGGDAGVNGGRPADSPGCGGGASGGTSGSSGAGADGAVIIYVKRVVL